MAALTIELETGLIGGRAGQRDWSLGPKIAIEVARESGPRSIESERAWSSFVARRVQLTGALRGQLLFRDGLLREITFAETQAGEASWDDWSWASEQRRYEAHEQLLERLLGTHGRQFPWGRVDNVLDEKAGAAFVRIVYA